VTETPKTAIALLKLDDFIVEARSVYAVFVSMTTQELLDLQAAHLVDQAVATTPESLAFGAGRLALIAAALKAREKAH
jgi:hypothetical protein